MPAESDENNPASTNENTFEHDSSVTGPGECAETTTPESVKRDANFSLPDIAGYHITAELGRGGMGVVYAANEDDLGGRPVALKVLPHAGGLSEQQVERFKTEARAAAKLSHGHIVPIYQIGEHKGTHYFAMQLIEGQDFAEVVSAARRTAHSRKRGTTKVDHREAEAETQRGTGARKKNAQEFDVSGSAIGTDVSDTDTKSALRLARTVAHIGKQVAEALHHAHMRGVVHRDIKPSNLLLDEEQKAWVTDFGLAQLQDSPALTSPGNVVGTLRYMSPEQASGRRAFVDNRTDIYSLGVTLYELCTLKAACRGRSPQDILRELTFERPVPIGKVNQRLPRDFTTIIGKAIERNPAERYQTAKALADDLERFLAGRPVAATPPTKLRLLRDWIYERPMAAAVMALTAVLAVLGFGSLAYAQFDRAQEAVQAKGVAEKELSSVQQALLLLQAERTAASNPALSLELFRQAAKANSILASGNTVLSALDQHREQHTVFLPRPESGQLVVTQDGQRMLKCVAGRQYDEGLTSELYVTETGELAATLQTDRPITTGVFTQSSDLLVTAGCDRQLLGPTQRFDDLTFSPVQVWAGPNFETSRQFPADTYAVRLSAAAIKNDALLLPKEGNLVNVYSLSGLREVGPLLRGHTAPVIDAIWSHSGDLIATWSTDRTVRLWEKDGTELFSTFVDCESPVHMQLEFDSSDDFLLLSGNGIQLLSTKDLEVVESLDGEIAAFSKDQRVFCGHRFYDYVYSYNIELRKRELQFPFSDGLLDFCLVQDDSKLAVANGNRIDLFDARGGKSVGSCLGHEDLVMSLAAIPRGVSQLGSISFDGSLRLWKVNSDAQDRTITSEMTKLGPRLSAFSKDGKQALLSTYAEPQTVIKESETFETEAVLEGMFLADLGGGQYLTRRQGHVQLWEPNQVRGAAIELSTRQYPEFAAPHPANEQGVLLLVGGELLHWDTSSGMLSAESKQDSIVTSAANAPASLDVWLGFSDGSVRIYSQDGMSDAFRVQGSVAPFENAIDQLSFSRTADRVLATTKAGRVVVWNSAEQRRETEIMSDTIPITNARFAYGGERIVTHAGAKTEAIVQWDVSTGEQIDSLEMDRVSDVRLDPTGKLLVVASFGSGATLWNLADGSVVELTKRKAGNARFVGQQVLITTSPAILPPEHSRAAVEEVEEFAILRWHLGEQKIVAEEQTRMQLVSLDQVQEKLFVSGLTYGCERINLDTRQSLGTYLGHTGALVLADFDKAGNVVTASSSGQILAYSKEGEPVQLAEHAFVISAAQLSEDGSQLVSTDASGSTRITSTVTQESRTKDFGFEHADRVRHQFLPDGNRMLSCDGSETVYVWDLREESVRKVQVRGGVFEIRVSQDAAGAAQALLLVGEKVTRVAANRIYAIEAEKKEELPDVVLLDMESLETKEASFEGDVIDAQYIAGSSQVALLTTKGVLLFVNKDSLTVVESIERKSRYQAFLDSYSANVAILASENEILGIDLSDHSDMWSLDANLDSFDWKFSLPGAKWALVPHRFDMQCVPLDLSDYIDRIGRRELRASEKKSYLPSGDGTTLE